MRIWSIILTGTGLALAAPALAGEAPVSALPFMAKSWAGPRHAGQSIMRPGTTIHRWGPRFQGRWFAGWHAPGGWLGYRRPTVGYVLPPYWLSPAYRVVNYGAYGLPAPVDGYGWSRYYDDAVMTDQYGRVQDHRSDLDWDRHDGDGPPPPDMGYDDEVTAPDLPPPSHAYEGRWTGTWRGQDGKAYSGEYEGRFEGDVQGGPGVDYDAPPYAAMPHGPHHAAPGQPIVTTTHAPGYIAGGYYYPGATTTTVLVQPAVTTTTSYVTEVTSRRQGAKRKIAHRCNCK